MIIISYPNPVGSVFYTNSINPCLCFKLIFYCFSKSIVNSEGLSALPHILHRPLVGRKTSFIDFKLIILLITEPHFPQTISIDGYDMIMISYTLFERISNFT